MHSSLFSTVRAAPRAMCGKRETEALTLTQVFPRSSAMSVFQLLRVAFRLPIVVLWHATKTTFAFGPARFVIAVVNGRVRAGSAGWADVPPAS